MYKEAIISIITIIVIIGVNIISENYTNESVLELTNELMQLRETISNENNNKENMEEKINYIIEKWYRRYGTLAYYLEHDELEKVEIHLTSLCSLIGSLENNEAKKELDETIFVLRHIQEKNKLNLKNIF